MVVFVRVQLLFNAIRLGRVVARGVRAVTTAVWQTWTVATGPSSNPCLHSAILHEDTDVMEISTTSTTRNGQANIFMKPITSVVE